jgi:hypothetical protein
MGFAPRTGIGAPLIRRMIGGDIWTFSRRSFNPCFRGCYSETLPPEHPKVYAAGFNPCFVGCYSETVTVIDYGSEITKFQSLFCWMTL